MVGIFCHQVLSVFANAFKDYARAFFDDNVMGIGKRRSPFFEKRIRYKTLIGLSLIYDLSHRLDRKFF